MTTGGEMMNGLLSRLLSDIHNHVEDNHDADRFPEGAAARIPSLKAMSLETFNIVIGQSQRLAEAYDLLADPASRALYLDLLAYRLAGPEHVKLPTNNPAHWQARRAVEAYVLGPSPLANAGPFGSLRRCRVPFLGREITLDCWPSSVTWSFLIRQYFFERDGARVAPAQGDVLIDGGACLGDTMLAFAAAAGETGHVHAFDPCAGHLEVMAANLAANPWARATIHPYGLSDRDQEGEPLPLSQIMPGFSVERAAGWPVPLRRIDTLVESGAIPRVDFIKLDIEGAERAALAGAAGTLRRFRPRLAVSLYHKPTDLFEIPLQLRDLDLGYRFYLDHYTIFHEETVLYAIA